MSDDPVDDPGDDPVDDLVDTVLTLAEAIPPGRVATYGDLARWAGRGGPRQIGRIMSLWGSSVPWWRVVGAHGRGPGRHLDEAFEHYRSEGTALTARGDRIDLDRARWAGPPGGP